MDEKQAAAIIEKELNTKVERIIDKTKGQDHQVYLATLPDKKVVLRIPQEDRNKIKLQAWACKEWTSRGVQAPEPLVLKPDYLIESCIEGTDLEDANLEGESKYQFFRELGSQLRKMHEVKTEQFGYFKEPGRGSSSNWNDFFKKDVLESLKDAVEKKRIDTETAERIKKLYKEHEPYLESFNSPRLLHSDLNGANLMVDQGRFSGVIDAADALSGDPLYDIGDMLYEFEDPKILDELEKTYGTLDRGLVYFYAVAANVWLLSGLKYEKEVEKARAKIEKLLIFEENTK